VYLNTECNFHVALFIAIEYLIEENF
jgi:hypothetical protein